MKNKLKTFITYQQHHYHRH